MGEKIVVKKGYFAAECGKCGFRGSSHEWLGGGQIADTGDYGDSYCPICGSPDLEEADNDDYVDQRELLLKKVLELSVKVDSLEFDLYQAKMPPY
jgi:hypothetical protein